MKLEITEQQNWHGRRCSERSLDLLSDNKSAGQFRYTLPHHDFVVLGKGALSQGVLIRKSRLINFGDFSIFLQ